MIVEDGSVLPIYAKQLCITRKTTTLEEKANGVFQ